MENWQTSGVNSPKEVWTRRWIAYIRKKASIGNLLNSHMTQMLTGHGAYKSFLFQIGIMIHQDVNVRRKSKL